MLLVIGRKPRETHIYIYNFDLLNGNLGKNQFFAANGLDMLYKRQVQYQSLASMGIGTLCVCL